MVWVGAVHATTYYAGAVTDCGTTYVCGNDALDGASTTTPKTLKTLLSTVAAGDTVILMCGTYYDSTATSAGQAFNPGASGTDGNPITFQSYIPLCAHFTLYQDNPLVRSWHTASRNYLVFDGIYVRGQLRLEGCTGCVVKNSEFMLGAWDGSSILTGLELVGSVSNTIKDNYCHDMTPPAGSYGAGYEILGFHNRSCIMNFTGGNNNIIEHNYIDGGGARYKDFTESARASSSWAGIGEKGGGLYNNTYRRNIIVGTNYCFQGMGATSWVSKAASHSHDQVIYENVCHDTQYGAIQFDHNTYGYQVYNNTFYNMARVSSTQNLGGMYFGNIDSASVGSSGDNLFHVFYNNIYHTFSYVYRKDPSFNATYSSCRVTNLLAPYPTLTASASGGSLATGTYWVRISTETDGTETGTGIGRSVDVTGPTGSITVDFDRTANVTGGPDNYRIYWGTTDMGQNTYISVAATGAAGSAQTATVTGSGGTTQAYLKNLVNQWQWPANFTTSDYNVFYSISTSIDRYNSGSSTHAATLATWKTYTQTIGNAGTCIAYDQNSISSDPLMDATHWDFRLPPTSPARSAGQGGVHIGAYPADVVSGGYGDIGPRNGLWVFPKLVAATTARSATTATATITPSTARY